MDRKRSLTYLLALAMLIVIKATSGFSLAQFSPCQLPKPEQDTLRLFPERTNYRTEFIRIDEEGERRGIGGEKLYREIEQRLGDKWDPVWEPKDLPYVFYELLKGPDRIGWIFGANQSWPGSDNTQIMCAFYLSDRITEFYYQKLPASADLRSMIKEQLHSKDFYSQFIGLTLEHFYVHEYLENLKVQDKDLRALDMISRMRDTSGMEQAGFLKTLRGMKLIFILIDDIKFANKVKKNEVFEKTRYLVEHKTEIPLLGPDALSRIQKTFPDASRFVVDLISLKGKARPIEDRLHGKLDPATEPEDHIYPVYVVYKDDVYQAPFVRGNILGYVLPLNLKTPKGKFTAVLAVDASEKDKGKILSFEVGNEDFPGMKGLSLVSFYSHEVLSAANVPDQKLDKVAALGRLKVRGKDATGPVLRAAELGLIITDEFYLNNFFNKDEITQKMRDYLKDQNK